MKRNSLPLFVVLGILVLGLLVWNVYLINQVQSLKQNQQELELKNRMLEGDNDILSYDLVTCRDSVRILNMNIEKSAK